MSKETLIIFIYDTELLTADSEDPVEAVLYFHPNWVSDTQKLALCGQLMGTAAFLKNCFFKPKVISLQNGKFALRQYGNLLLAVGTDRNISDSLIESRADLLTNLINLYHCNLLHVSKGEESENVLKSRKRLSEKLYQILETFLPILQYNNNGNILQNQPKLKISKSSAGNIFLDAIETLQSCQQHKGVLGGAILYHNKVVATQLTETTTKNLVLTDPLRIKSAAEIISHTGFHIPIGVQLIVVYVTEDEYQMLFENSRKLQNFLENQNQQLLPLKWSSGGISSAGSALKQRKIKRDKSLIFSNIPEESHEDHPPKANKTNQKRPTNLSLRLGSNDKKQEVSVVKSEDKILFDETDSYPEYIGRTSVCNTPMTENKVFVGSIKPICANPTEDINTKATDTPSDRRRSSTSITEDITDSLKKISKNITRKFTKTDINKNNGNDTNSTSSDEHTMVPIDQGTEVEEINRNNQKSTDVMGSKTMSDRRKLSLPLKPLTSDAADIFEEKRRLSTAGIQLTPLIAKLSILAMNDILTPNPEKAKPRRASKTFENNLLNTKYQNVVEDRKKVELFICGQQNMTLLLLMEAGTSSKQAVVQKLFDVCVAKLSKIENNLNQTLNMNIQGQGDQKFQTMGIAGASGYSFLSLDAKWDTIQKEGLWNTIDFFTMEHMHKDLVAEYPITDLIMRTDENVVFGFKSGRNEYFSKQTAQNYNGIPPPSDVMGSISLKTMNHLSQSTF